jgi:hypothetical protein
MLSKDIKECPKLPDDSQIENVLILRSEKDGIL